MSHERLFILTGALCGLLTVALGAFATHGLKHQLTPEMLLVFQKAAYYQGLHAPVILLVGLMLMQHNSRALLMAGWSFLLGILLFSGSLYLLAVTGSSGLGIITPFGGMAFLIGWLSLLIAGWSYSRS